VCLHYSHGIPLLSIRKYDQFHANAHCGASIVKIAKITPTINDARRIPILIVALCGCAGFTGFIGYSSSRLKIKNEQSTS
jgi:hypothetical protein